MESHAACIGMPLGSFPVRSIRSPAGTSCWGAAGALLLALAVPAARATPTAVAPPFRINTYVPDTQWEPAVASAGDGFVVVWGSAPGQDGSDGGIFGQRFDAGDAPLGPEFQVNTYTTGAQTLPDVAVRDDGSFVVAWQSLDQGGPGTQIFGQRFDGAGAPVGGEFQVSASSQPRDARVAFEASDGFIIAWSADDGDSTGTFARRYDASGAPVGPEFQVNSYTTGFQNAAQVAGLPGGGFVVSWQGLGPGVTRGVFARIFDGTGTALGPEFALNETVPLGIEGPSMAADAAGELVVAWFSNDAYPATTIRSRRFAADGTLLGPEEIVASAGLTLSAPSVAVDPTGRHLIAWEASSIHSDCPNGLAGRFYDASGGAEGPEFGLLCDDLLPPFPVHVEAASLGGQRYVTSWAGHAEQDYDVSARLYGLEAALPGKKLLVRDPGAPAERKIVLRVQADYLSTQPGSGVDPVADGLYLNVYNDAGSGEAACFALPAAGWTAKGNPLHPTLKYRDPDGLYGPCKAATVKDGRTLKVACRALVQPIPYSLDEMQQQAIGVAATAGDVTYCVRFGGQVARDAPGLFKAKAAPAPSSCPVPPIPCP